jgi:hypothetical protein
LRIDNLAGFRKRTDQGWDFFATGDAWKEMCKGFDPPEVAAKQMLITNEPGRRNYAVSVPGYGRPRLYHLSSKLLEGGD